MDSTCTIIQIANLERTIIQFGQHLNYWTLHGASLERFILREEKDFNRLPNITLFFSWISSLCFQFIINWIIFLGQVPRPFSYWLPKGRQSYILPPRSIFYGRVEVKWQRNPSPLLLIDHPVLSNYSAICITKSS